MSGPITADVLDEIFAKKDIALESDLNSLEKMIENSISNHESIVNYFTSQRIKLADDIEEYMKRFEVTKQKANNNWSNFTQMISSETIVTPHIGSFLEILGERLKVKFPNWYTAFIESESKKLNVELVDIYTELDKSRLEPQRKIRSNLINEIPKLANEMLVQLREGDEKMEGDSLVMLETKIHQLQVIDQMIVQVFKEISQKFDSFLAFAENHYTNMQRKSVKFEDYHAQTGPHPKDIVYTRMGFNIFLDEAEAIISGNPIPEKLVRTFLESLQEESRTSEGILLNRHDAFEKILPYGNPLSPQHVQPIDKIKEDVNIEWLGHYEKSIFPICMGPRGWILAEIRKSPLEEINIYDSNHGEFAHLHEKIGHVLREFVSKTIDYFGKDGSLESKKFLIKSKRVPISPYPQDNSILFLKNLMLLSTKHELHLHSYTPADVSKTRRRLHIFFCHASPEGQSELKIEMESKTGEANEFEKSSSVAFRCKEGIFSANFQCESLEKCSKISPAKENMIITQDGKYLVAVHNSLAELFLLQTQKTLASAPFTNIYASSLSPSEKFLAIMDFIGKDNYRLNILKMPSLEKVKDFSFKNFSLEKWPVVKFAKEDSLAFMAQRSDLLIMETSEFSVSKKIAIADIDYLSMSTSPEGLSLLAATFEKSKGFEKIPSHLTLLSDSNWDSPLYSQQLDKAQDLKAFFSPDGKNIIVLTQTFHDETGKSYYGQSNLYIFKRESSNFKRIPTKEGPVHDICWSPDSEYFILISGFMPAQSVLFDKKVNAIFEFGTHYRNLVKWNPFSRFVVLAGFGNLNGEMEVWDIKKQECIGKGKSECAIKLDWAKDGRHFITAVLNPRLRVNNNYKIFKYNCKQIRKFDFSDSELYEAHWVPLPNLSFTDRDPSPPAKEEVLTDEKPRRLFNPKGRSSKIASNADFMAVLKGEQQGHSRKLSNSEYLKDVQGNVNLVKKGPAEKPAQNYPPGYVPPPDKKKKKKKKQNIV